METVTSKDGTTIAFDTFGKGNPLILVTGALGKRPPKEENQLAKLLSEHFTVIEYDRRGRGDSTDTQPYAVEREIEDIDTLIDHVGGSAYLYGMSSGAILALETTQKLSSKVTKLALYEPPFIVDDSRPPLPENYVKDLYQANVEEDREKAILIFFKQALLIPDEYIEPMRQSPMWDDMKSVAHTLAYDGVIVQDHLRGEKWSDDMWSNVTMPTCVICGEHTEEFMFKSGQILADDLANSQFKSLAGQSHNVDATVLAPTLIEFFTQTKTTEKA